MTKRHICDDIDKWLFDKLDEPSKYHIIYAIMAALWFMPRNFITTIHYRLFIRGMCALKGCDVHYSCGGNLPDDVCEWYCRRCHAEGINHVIYSIELLYGDNKTHDFIDVLRGK